MARPLRLEYAGALYHITSRGDRREDIFESDDDFQMFLEVLGEVCERFNWVCHAYCLMTNHYHLLIETPDGNLSKGMRQLNGVYTQKFNRAHNRVGHVFQGRYKGILVEKQNYLLELCRYIVLNPVRAEMVRSAKDWPWSSYRATSGQVEKPEWLDVNWIIASFGKRRQKAIEGYRSFVKAGKGQPSPWKKLKNQVYLGSDEFVEQILESIRDDKHLSEVPSSQKRAAPKPLQHYEKSSKARDEAIFNAYQSDGYSMQEIGDYFGLHYSRVSRILKAEENKRASST